jgi:predicted TPR repeat methyltransferase
MGRALDRPEVADTYNAALDAEKAGEIDKAVALYERYLTLDPDDHGGAAVRLAALMRGVAPERAPEAYVETLFDQHAHVFESILVDALGYDVPRLTQIRLDALGLGPFTRMLDLGCGTGLGVRALGERVKEAIGLDLSSRMIDVCEELDIYDGLYVGEAEDFLAENDEDPFDLITALDVLPYIGDVRKLFEGAAANLLPGGVFAFSSETLEGGEIGVEGYAVAPHQRYVHRLDYLEERLKASGFEMLSHEDINVRMQNDAPTPGFLIVAQLSR